VGLHVAELIGSAHHFKSDGNRHLPTITEGVKQVDTLDRTPFAVIKVPAHDLVLIRPDLFQGCPRTNIPVSGYQYVVLFNTYKALYIVGELVKR
jgi:hypothetical protein